MEEVYTEEDIKKICSIIEEELLAAGGIAIQLGAVALLFNNLYLRQLMLPQPAFRLVQVVLHRPLKLLSLYLFQGFPFLLCCLTIFTNGECHTGFDMAVKVRPEFRDPVRQRPGRRP